MNDPALRALLLTALIPSGLCSQVQAQNTCHTNPQGVTLCSTDSGVIHGSTSDSGNTVFRDDRGRQLDFETDSRGSATVKPAQGDPVRWSQPVLGSMKYPKLDTAPPRPSMPAAPLRPIIPGSPIPPTGQIPPTGSRLPADPIPRPARPFGR